eukprot:jgi/Ulvmu1/8149/UM040_0046.1
MARAERPSLASLPDLMDVDLNIDLPDDLFEFDNQFLDEYLKRVRDDKSTSMMLPSIDLDDAFLNPQAPSMALASHSTSAGSHPPVPTPADQVFTAPQRIPDSSAPAPDQFIPGPDMAQPAADPRQEDELAQQQMFAMPGQQEEEEDVHIAPPQSAAHSTANEDPSDSQGVSSAAQGSGSRGRKSATAPRKATPQRKQNNRKAQQRYREKRKMQASEREEQVKALSAQLAAMQGLQAENQKQATENDELRNQLLEKQGEIEALRKMMEAGFVDIGARSHSDHSSEGVDLKMESGDADSPSAAGPGADDRLEAPGLAPLRLTHDEAAARLKQLVGEMRAILESHGLPSSHCLSGDLRYDNPALKAALQPLAHQIDRMSMRRLLTAPAKPQERSKCDSSRFASAHPCALFRARWTGALEAMALSDDQAEALLAARAQTLDRLRTLYEERHELNNMTMAIMLPRPAPESFYDGTTARKLELMGQFGGKCALSHGQQLAEALDKIRENLRAEQRIMVQLHSVLVLKVLTPAQAAIMFALAEEELVEPLHITNIVALNRGVIELLPMCRSKPPPATGAEAEPAPAATGACDPGCEPVDCAGECGADAPRTVPPPGAWQRTPA